jgi:hypothetical protein
MGRLQLEPWLWARVNKKNVRLWPNSRIAEWRTTSRGTIEARLERGNWLSVDHVLFATGYRVDLSRMKYLEEEVAQGRSASTTASQSLMKTFKQLCRDFTL